MALKNIRGIKAGTKIDIRDRCKQCGAAILDARFRTFCGDKCRIKFYNDQHPGRSAAWQKADRDKKAGTPGPGKTKCLICGNWYKEVGAHTHQRHGMAAKLYREKYGIEVKKRKRSGKTVDNSALDTDIAKQI